MRLQNVQHTFFLGILLLTTLAFVGLLQDFLMPVFWAAVLAVIFQPVQQRWLRGVRGRTSLASVLTVLTVLVVVILPLFLIGLAVARESVALYEKLASGEVDWREPIRWMERTLPLANDYLARFGIELEQLTENLSGAAVTVSQFLAARALDFTQDALRFTALLFLMLYVLFFFLRDGQRILDGIVRALPLGDARERQLLEKFAGVSRATLKGTLVVGVVQGSLGGLMFWMLGLAAPVFWGVIMTVLSLLPAVGAAIVWLPAALILLTTGQVVKGLVLIAAGTLLIGLADNILRPILVGRDTKMPDFLILLATLGGLTVFGISGFVIGPIIAAFFLAVWEMFAQEYVDDVPPAPLPPAPPLRPASPEPPPSDGDLLQEGRHEEER